MDRSTAERVHGAARSRFQRLRQDMADSRIVEESGEFFVEHVVRDTGSPRTNAGFATLVSLMLVRLNCAITQLITSRFQDENGMWVVRQASFDCRAHYAAHVTDSLFEGPRELEVLHDERWEATIRRGLDEAFPGQLTLLLLHTKGRGREVIIWNLATEVRAIEIHEKLLALCPAMLCGCHFSLQSLAALNSSFERAGWVVFVHEH